MDPDFAPSIQDDHEKMMEYYKTKHPTHKFDPNKFNEEEDPWYVYNFVLKLNDEREIPPSYELKQYKPGSKIIIETHAGSVYDGTYCQTECNGLRMLVVGIAKFPDQIRLKDNDEQHFYASEIKSLRFLYDDAEDDTLWSVACPALRGLSYNEFLHGKALLWDFIYLPVFDNRCQEAFDEISCRDVIGIMALGSHLEKVRFTKISFFIISTSRKIYLFDIKLTPKHFWKGGLRQILEDTTIEKVVHDGKILADLLYNRYWKIKLENVFDVQIADYFIRKKNGECVDDLRSFPVLTDKYLNLPPNMFLNSEWLKEHWLHYKRPANTDLKIFSALTVAYLIPLRHTLHGLLSSNMHQLTQAYAEMLVSRSQKCHNEVLTQKIPEQFKEYLSIFKQEVLLSDLDQSEDDQENAESESETSEDELDKTIVATTDVSNDLNQPTSLNVEIGSETKVTHEEQEIPEQLSECSNTLMEASNQISSDVTRSEGVSQLDVCQEEGETNLESLKENSNILVSQDPT